MLLNPAPPYGSRKRRRASDKDDCEVEPRWPLLDVSHDEPLSRPNDSANADDERITPKELEDVIHPFISSMYNTSLSRFLCPAHFTGGKPATSFYWVEFEALLAKLLQHTVCHLKKFETLLLYQLLHTLPKEDKRKRFKETKKLFIRWKKFLRLMLRSTFTRLNYIVDGLSARNASTARPFTEHPLQRLKEHLSLLIEKREQGTGTVPPEPPLISLLFQRMLNEESVTLLLAILTGVQLHNTSRHGIFTQLTAESTGRKLVSCTDSNKPLPLRSHRAIRPLPLGLIAGPEFQNGRRVFTHGNYSAYYSSRHLAFQTCPFNPPSTAPQLDPRLQLLNQKFGNVLFRGKSVLDIGCNCGMTTLAVGGVLEARSVVGIDIDAELVARALECLRVLKDVYVFHALRQPETSTMGSRQRYSLVPLTENSRAESVAPSYTEDTCSPTHAADPPPLQRWAATIPPYIRVLLPPLPDSGISKNLHQFLRSIWERDPTVLPQTPTPNVTPTEEPMLESPFPFNVSFVAEDFTRCRAPAPLQVCQSKVAPSTCETEVSASSCKQYDTILALSVTKWMHLNSGDEGLQRAFRTMAELLVPGGYLVLEPQSWESYRKKRRITNDFKARIPELTFRPQAFDTFLQTELHFEPVAVLRLYSTRAGEPPASLSEGGGVSEICLRPLFLYKKPT